MTSQQLLADPEARRVIWLHVFRTESFHPKAPVHQKQIVLWNVARSSKLSAARSPATCLGVSIPRLPDLCTSQPQLPQAPPQKIQAAWRNQGHCRVMNSAFPSLSGKGKIKLAASQGEHPGFGAHVHYQGNSRGLVTTLR